MIEVFLANGFHEIDLRSLRYGWTGVYVLFNRQGESIYVGQGNVGCRVRAHNYRNSPTKWARAVALEVDSRTVLALEAEIIRLLNPRFNRSRSAFRRRHDHPIVDALASLTSEALAS